MTEQRSAWRVDEARAAARLQPLQRDLVTDVCVIGAGMAGLLCALELAERGRSVIVVERESIAGGETQRTTAHLTAMLDSRYFELAKMHGAEAARTVALSHMRAIAHMERLANAYGIDCNFRRISGFLCASDEKQAADLSRELEAATDAGLRCEMVRRAPLPFWPGPALHVPYQADFEPLALIAGVVRVLESKGVPIYAPVTVQNFDSESATAQVGLRTSEGHSIKANYVVVATNSPINDVTTMHTKQAAYRTYALSLAIPEATPVLGWDLDDPYHYVRSTIDARTARPVLIVGGEDHRFGQETDGAQHWRRLEAWARDRFPEAGELVSEWSGQVLEPSDGLGFIGRNPGQERIFIVTGQSGNGMTYSALSAELIADLVEGVATPFEKIYDPSRKPSSLAAIGSYVSENINTVGQYSDWLGPADASRVEDIPHGEGAVMRRGLTRVAVYVDAHGRAHEMSATCPHLGGVVTWNAAQKSWDCPCHGSRFDCHGKVLQGPAVSDLKSVEPEAAKAREPAEAQSRHS